MHGVGLLLLLSIPLAPADEASRSPIGRQIEDFQLGDYLGTKHALADWAEKKAVVVVFLGVECPLAKLYGPRLAALAEKYERHDVAIIGIDANRHDSLAEMAHYARTHGIDFPLLKDPGNLVADRFGARRTPEAFVLDQRRVVRYWGRIDNQYGVGYARAAATRHDVAEALDELLAGKPVSQPTTEPVGCLIGRVRKTPPTGDVTFTGQIAGILNRHCVACHREGEIAPFSLTSYDEVVGWADTIREVIDQGRMPPWHASPEHGHFANDARLPPAATEQINTWVRNGCPQGDPAQLPEPPEFFEGWQISRPDLVLKTPQPFEVKAKGVVPYKYFTIHSGFAEDKWVKAAEARPGNRSVTHHLILFYLPPGQERMRPEDPLFNSIVGFAPGLPAAIYPDGVYRRIPAGSKLMLQAHYTPTGTAQTDQSEVGLVFADPQKVSKEMTVAAVLNWQFLIPPGAKNYRVEGKHRFGQDMLLYSLTPHMHLRGKSFKFEAVYPGGEQEVLLDVPRYDFNWQNSYLLTEPKRMPEGTEIRCTAYYDNSAENLVNPDPAKPVYWGDQTWEEMMVGTFGVSLAEQDLTAGLPAVKPLADGQYEVAFRYRPTAKVREVYLAGNFNDWQPKGHLMKGPDADGCFTTRLKLTAGTYEYKFVLDGEHWRSDPTNPTQVGIYRNSQLQVGEAP